MSKRLGSISVLALLTALSACGESRQPADNVAATDMNGMMADPNNPFAQSEMAMDTAMSAAVGVTAQDSWVRKMIEHHRGAVDMSRIVLTLNPTADVAKLAQMTIDMQRREIAILEKLVAKGNANPTTGELYRPAEMQMHNAMMGANGVDVSETYLRKMFEHHKGAVAMSDVALANGATGAVQAQIEKTKKVQQKEIAQVEAMLRGDAMTAPTNTQSSTASAANPTAPKAAAPKSAPPKKSAPSAPKPAPDPHAGHDMNAMNNM